jgi:hypothetical protein
LWALHGLGTRERKGANTISDKGRRQNVSIQLPNSNAIVVFENQGKKHFEEFLKKETLT